jgi:peptidoglycan/LPS O-acetylase OafA/YrhL
MTPARASGSPIVRPARPATPRATTPGATKPRAATAAWTTAPEVGTPFRVAGLDGLRAVAVTLVILFHLSPGTAVGGYLGVDIFFVVSGFLITSLLLREISEHGRIALRAFWARRARRLLPALIVLILICCSCAALVGGDLLVGLGRQVLGAMTFSSNWLMISNGSDYFDDSLPELFRNLWSLGIEEQFYLVWPLLILLFAVVPTRARLRRILPMIVASLLALASASAMAVLWSPREATRVYYGSDTHAFGLAVGALLAFLSVSWPQRPLEWSRPVRRLLGAVGPVATLCLVLLSAVMPSNQAVVFRGGLILVSLLTAAVIATLLVPATPLARVFELGAIRWVGRRSYGLYLWHWPVFVLVVSALPGWRRDGASGWALGAIALAITVAAAAASYALVEQPIRRLGVREVARRIRRGCRASLPRRGAAVTVGAVVLVAGALTVVALSSDPGTGDTQLAVEAGQQAIRDAQSHDAATPTPSPSATPTGPATGPQITAIGDSVMLAAAPELEARFPGISIDAAVSRRLPQAVDIVDADVAAETLRPVVVVGLATNGPIDRTTLQRIRDDLGPDRELVVVSAQAPRGWIDPNNAILSAFADRYRDVELADWHGAAQPILGELNRDQIHFGPTGARAYTDAIQQALERLAELPAVHDAPPDHRRLGDGS